MSMDSLGVSERVDESVRAVRARVSNAPRIGIVLGSGLGSFADSLGDLRKVSYVDIPHLPAPKVAGHAGNLCFGFLGDVSVVCMQGRVHLYEGHPIWQVVHGARMMARLGVECVLVTNAAGGLEAGWSTGDLMLVTDHLNLTGHNPLVGPNAEALGTRFPDMTCAYDLSLQENLRSAARKANVTIREGVYAGLLGPSYETPAEVRMLRTLGAHAVGMSTVGEVIALRHMGVRVGALSCITNLAAGVGTGVLHHEEVEATAKARRGELEALLRGWVMEAVQL